MKKKILMVTGATVLVTSALALLKVKKSKNLLEEETVETKVIEEISTHNS